MFGFDKSSLTSWHTGAAFGLDKNQMHQISANLFSKARAIFANTMSFAPAMA